MVVIAVLLLLVVVAVVVFVVIAGSTGTVTLEWDQLNLFFQPSPLVLFLLGAATLLLAVAAIAMLRAGSRRSMAKRRELKRLRRLEGEQNAQGTAGGAGAATRTDGAHAGSGTTKSPGTPADGTRYEGGSGGYTAPGHDPRQQATATETRPVRPEDGPIGRDEPPRR